jgi:hypothetical protein
MVSAWPWYVAEAIAIARTDLDRDRVLDLFSCHDPEAADRVAKHDLGLADLPRGPERPPNGTGLIGDLSVALLGSPKTTPAIAPTVDAAPARFRGNSSWPEPELHVQSMRVPRRQQEPPSYRRPPAPLVKYTANVPSQCPPS